MRKTTLHVWIAMLFCLVAVMTEAVQATDSGAVGAAPLADHRQ